MLKQTPCALGKGSTTIPRWPAIVTAEASGFMNTLAGAA